MPKTLAEAMRWHTEYEREKQVRDHTGCLRLSLRPSVTPRSRPKLRSVGLQP